MRRTGVVLLLLLAGPAARAADLDYPKDALAVVRLEPQPLWTHDLMKTVRDTVQAAGPQATAAFLKQVYPDPAKVEAVSLMVLRSAGRQGPIAVGRIDLSEPLDTARALRVYLPGAVEQTMSGRAVYTAADLGLSVTFPNPKRVIVGPPDMVREYVSMTVADNGPMPDILRPLAGKPFFAAVNVKALPLPPQAFEQIPEPIRPLAKADRVTLALDLDKAPTLTLRVGYPDAAATADAEGAVKAAAGMLKQLIAGPKAEMERKLMEKADAGPRPPDEAGELLGALFLIGAVNRANALLDAPPVKRDGTTLTASVELPGELGAFGPGGTAVAIGLLLPAVQKVREAAARTQSSNNLKQIGLAIHNYHDTFNAMPGNVYSKDGKPLLSWRVQILPFIEQDNLYRQFKLDEPWDSEHNRKLLPLMPKTYMIPNARVQPADRTYYQSFVGKKGAALRPFLVEGGAKTGFASVVDGLSNTLMVAEAGDAVEWTKPDDLPFAPGTPLPKLGGHTAGGFTALLGDGSVRFIRDTIDRKTLEALITINGGEVVNLDR